MQFFRRNILHSLLLSKPYLPHTSWILLYLIFRSVRAMYAHCHTPHHLDTTSAMRWPSDTDGRQQGESQTYRRSRSIDLRPHIRNHSRSSLVCGSRFSALHVPTINRSDARRETGSLSALVRWSVRRATTILSRSHRYFVIADQSSRATCKVRVQKRK